MMDLTELKVNCSNNRSYQIIIAEDFNYLAGAISDIGLSDRKMCIVTETNVAPLYLDEIINSLKSITVNVTAYVFPAGEENKTLDTVRGLYEHLILNHFERRDILVALGGGVVGDLTGYCAATYLRGISFIQIPTSLLSQVDSSIGGKTGVDFSSYKNMVGAFHQPSLVYSNVSTLRTLTRRQYVSGLGEIVKHGLIKDASYFRWLKENRELILSRDTSTMIEMIRISDEIKREVVEKDPFEKGERAILNFGHTLGHSIEKLMDFTMLHGECVSTGMVLAAKISYNRQYITREEYEEIIEVLKGFELPVTVSGSISPEDITRTAKSDKKMERGMVKFILLSGTGRAVICHDVTDEEMRRALSREDT